MIIPQHANHKETCHAFRTCCHHCRNSVVGTGVCRSPDWNKVDQALGRSGAAMPGDVHRYGFPRSDLHVTVDGVTLLPALALGGWLAFKAEGDGAMVMGDLVLTEDEINPVMSKLLAGGVAVTAVHNHLLRAQPATFYMHVDGHGDATSLATTLHDALAASHTPLAAPSASAAAKPDLDAEQIEQVIGRKGNAVGGVLQFGIPRGDAIVDDGHAGAARHGHCDRGQFPADRRWQGGDHRRLRAGGEARWNLCWPRCAMRASR